MNKYELYRIVRTERKIIVLQLHSLDNLYSLRQMNISNKIIKYLSHPAHIFYSSCRQEGETVGFLP